jgi:hypothetical protein
VSTARVTGTGVTGMEILAVKLKAADPKLRRALYKRLRDESRPTADAVRRSALDMPAYKYRDRGLREEIAATITTSASVTKTGARVSINSLGKRMPEGKQNLPAYTDRAPGWAHPVFAQGERFHLGPSRAHKYRGLPEAFRPLVKRGSWVWVHQFGQPGWFENPIIARAPQLRNACQKAVDDIARELT